VFYVEHVGIGCSLVWKLKKKKKIRISAAALSNRHIISRAGIETFF
jgi:hypothetical protein